MSVSKRLFVTGLLAAACLGSCDKKNDSSSSESASTSPNGDNPEITDNGPGNVNIGTDKKNSKISFEGLEPLALDLPPMLPPVAANTPGSLAIDTSGFSLSGIQIDCAQSYANCPNGSDPNRDACVFIADVKCRFFSESGPTQVKQILGNIDQTMSTIESSTKNKYVPCLDPVGNKDGLELETEEKKEVIPAFASVKYEGKFSGLTDKSGTDKEEPVDLAFEFEFSCLDKEDDSESWKAIGVKTNETGKKVYSIGEMLTGSSYRNGGVGTIDEDNNVNYWGIVSATGLTQLGAGGAQVLFNLKSSAIDKRIELTFTGESVGPDCGMRMISDKNLNYLIAEANMNATASCESGDTGYNAAKDNLTFCIKVDGDDPEIASLQDCVDEGLTASLFSRAMLKSSEVPPWEIHKLLTAPVGVSKLKVIEIPPEEDEAESESEK